MVITVNSKLLSRKTNAVCIVFVYLVKHLLDVDAIPGLLIYPYPGVFGVDGVVEELDSNITP
jgi:hypothetical protein